MRLSKWKHIAFFAFIGMILFFACNHDNRNKNIEGKEDTPSQKTLAITKIMVADTIKEGSAIAQIMEFAVPTGMLEVPIKVETNSKNATVDFVEPLTDGKLLFPSFTGKPEELSKTLKIILKDGDKQVEYTVSVKKIIQDIGIYGGRRNGRHSMAQREQLLNILDHKSPTITIAGPYAEILASTYIANAIWTSFKVNGKELKIDHDIQYSSSCKTRIKLGNKGETIQVKIEIETNPIGTDGKPTSSNLAKEELNFNIQRENETVDFPAYSLFISGKDVLNGAIDVPKMYADLCSGSKPIFEGAEPSRVLVKATDKLSSITIDSQNPQVEEETEQGLKIWKAEASVQGVKASGVQGKEVQVVMTPEDTEAYHTTTWSFRLIHKEKEAMNVSYVINGKDETDLGYSFTLGIVNGTNPSTNVKGKYLNLKLISRSELKNVEINGTTINEDAITTKQDHGTTLYICKHSLNIGMAETQINVRLNPKDEDAFFAKEMKFKVTGDASKEEIVPKFEEINGNTSLPNSFISKLATTDVPRYNISGENAKIVISLAEYVADFLCKEVRVGNEKQPLEYVADYVNPKYKFEKIIAVAESTPKTVSIAFEGVAGISESLTWNFELERGGSKPPLPESNIFSLTLNEKGSSFTPFETGFKEHLTDGSNPEFGFDGGTVKAKLTVEATKQSAIKNIEFVLDDVVKETKTLTAQGGFFSASYDFVFSDNTARVAKVVVYPKDEATYSPLVYSFTLKPSGNKLPPQLNFMLNNKGRSSGYTATLDAEVVTLAVQALNDDMGDVKIGIKGDLRWCPVKKLIDNTGKPYYEARKVVSLPLDREKEIVIEVKPKNTNKYGNATCTYKLKGTKVARKNAEFAKNHKNEFDIVSLIDWKDGKTGYYADDYGAEKLVIVARTKSPRAQVKLEFLDIENNSISGTKKSLTYNKSEDTHTSEKLTLYPNKPTRLKVWVIAEDNFTEDSVNGVWTYDYNPIKLAWGYQDKEKVADYTSFAYDEILIEKTQIQSNNKIYILFGMYDEETYHYTVDNNALPAGQDSLFKFAKSDGLQYYKSNIDVTELIKDDATIDHMEVICKVKKDDVLRFTYKVNIKIKR